MLKNLSFLCVFISLSATAQKRLLYYTPSSTPVFINQLGDTLGKALLGGLNQPQFHALDINNDGKKDLFVYDRTGHVIMPFINTGTNDITNYKYSPKYISCFPKLENYEQSTWVQFVDYDNDGKEDLWASINFKVVILRNITKSGDKMVKFEQISPFLKAFKYSGDPDNTDPNRDSINISASANNIPAIGDVDGDGDIDMFSYEPNQGNLLLYRNRTKDFNLPLHPPIFDMADLCWGNFRDTAYDGIKLFACPYKYYRFKKHTGGSTLLWFDNDNDGDMDMLMGNAGGKNMIYLKNGKKEFNLAQDSMIAYDGHWPKGNTVVDMFSFPAAFMLDADGDGAKDIIVAPNQFDTTYKIDQTKQVWFYKNNGNNTNPDFRLEKKNYFTDEFLDHGGYTSPVLIDIDNDKDLDLILASNGDHAKTGDKAFRLILYKNIGSPTQPIFKLEDEDLWDLSLSPISSLSVTFGDLTGDGLPEMLAGDLSGSITYFKNIGQATNWGFTSGDKNYIPLKVGQNSSPQLIDLDKDGKLDLVIGEKKGNFNYYRNTGSTSVPQYTLTDDTLGNFFTNEFVKTNNPPSYSNNGFASGIIADLDNDGNNDMVFGGEEGRIRVMKFTSVNQQNFDEDTTVLFDSVFMRYNTMDFGNLSRPAVGDLDGDSINDIIVGNDRGGINFLKGSVKILAPTELHKFSQPNVYPNPSNGNILNINKKSRDKFTFSLYDLTGKLVQTEQSETGTEVYSMVLKTGIQGIYILQSTSKGGENFYTRVIVSK